MMSRKEEDLESPYVLIIGSSNMDLNIYSERLPKPGETITGGSFKQSFGGKGANQAVASARSGSRTIFMGKIGEDAFGDQMIAQLTKEGIDTRHIVRDPENASGIAFILVDKNGENMISVAPGANFKLTPIEVRSKADLIKSASCLIVQMEIPMETIEELFKIASKASVLKILNPAPLKPIAPEILKNIDIIVPNEGELFRLHSLLKLKEIKELGTEKIARASKDITRLGVKIVITTMGKKGCVIHDAKKDKIVEVPAIKVNAVDTVGAGDCFNGVLASMLNKGKSLETAVKYATAAASIKVTRKGAQDGMPYLNEIEERFKELNEMLNKLGFKK